MNTTHSIALFYIGSNVLDWPLEAQRGVADGMFPIALLVFSGPIY